MKFFFHLFFSFYLFPAKDGSSYEKAIERKAKSELEGVSAEYKWLKEDYPATQDLIK